MYLLCLFFAGSLCVCYTLVLLAFVFNEFGGLADVCWCCYMGCVCLLELSACYFADWWVTLLVCLGVGCFWSVFFCFD